MAGIDPSAIPPWGGAGCRAGQGGGVDVTGRQAEELRGRARELEERERRESKKLADEEALRRLRQAEEQIEHLQRKLAATKQVGGAGRGRGAVGGLGKGRGILGGGVGSGFGGRGAGVAWSLGPLR